MTRAPSEHNGLARVERWFAESGREPFEYQRDVWSAYLAGRSGLVHAPTGTGKTLAVWLGPVAEALAETAPRPPGRARRSRAASAPATVLWITPLRALATDTAHALAEPIEALSLLWSIEKRTGDTPASLKAKQRQRLPTALVTTPESATLLLSYPDARDKLAGVRCVIVDEWHELLGSKRGVQTELLLARLRTWNPRLRVWGLSATLGNLGQARDVLLGADSRDGLLVSGAVAKRLDVATVLPRTVERFPWAGHLGTVLADQVIDAVESANSTLLFTNTRSQTELWYRTLLARRPEWMPTLAVHHGSIDRDVRAEVERRVRNGELRCVVCTSSLDLGVDFSPVDQVIQVGSPKGVARLMQRAGRSGHRPGVPSRVLGVPTNLFELVEFAAARRAAHERAVEPRTPHRKPLDVLVQHLVTVGLGGGFEPHALHREITRSHAYADLSFTEFSWALDFATKGGAALGAYPMYHRLARLDDGSYAVTSAAVAKLHRLAIGTISADTALRVRYQSGGSLGTIEESFIARLAPGDRFIFAGKALELVRVREMTALVKPARSRSGAVPVWQGGRSPLSTLLAEAVRDRLDAARRGDFEDPELAAARPALELQQRWSRIPAPDELLVERQRSRSGHHTYLFPFAGRHAHEGLGALLAHRLAKRRPVTLSVTVNDYGIELLASEDLDLTEDDWRRALSTDALLPDLLDCLNSSQLARRGFREIARIAGLIHQGYPGGGPGAAKSARQMQASSELFFDVFNDFDPANLLLDQARREVLDRQLEVQRLRATLQRLADACLTIVDPPHCTPMAFPLRAESLRTQHVSTETWRSKIERLTAQLEAAADARPARRSGAAT